MKNEPLQQSSSNLSHFITYFNLPRLLLNFIICTFVAATLALIFSLYMKEYVSVSSIVPSNFDVYFDLQSYTPPSLPPPPPPPLSPPPPPPPSPPEHRVLHLDVKQAPIEQMEDEELLRRVAMQQEKNVNFPSDVIPKVAFLFLTKEELGLRLLWEKFFQGHDGLFSIYVHYSPSYNGSVPKSSVFHDRRISSKEVEWGLFNMVEAERRLLANALLDKSNERFVLLSETTIPLYNFSTIYNYLMNSRSSFVEVYDLPNAAGRGRYNPHMSPTVTIKQWRKGSQWFEINQELARLVVTDQLYFHVFAKYCQRSCYADEHYLPTFVHIVASDKNSGRTLTWADWSRHRPHPSSFNGRGVTESFLISIQNSTKCEYNGEQTNMCYLFARKFTPDALDKLLRFAPRVLGFNGS